MQVAILWDAYSKMPSLRDFCGAIETAIYKQAASEKKWPTCLFGMSATVRGRAVRPVGRTQLLVPDASEVALGELIETALVALGTLVGHLVRGACNGHAQRVELAAFHCGTYVFLHSLNGLWRVLLIARRLL